MIIINLTNNAKDIVVKQLSEASRLDRMTAGILPLF